jgi:carboxyl-terminal processing protease
VSNRQRQSTIVFLAWLAPALLVIGVWLGGHPEDLPRFARSAFEANHQTQVVNEALSIISKDYYRPLSKDKLVNASISGAVASLDDRFSHYLTAKEFGEFDSPPSFAGIGVEVDPERAGLSIARVFDSSPALRAGLKAGEVIVEVNGRKLQGLSSKLAIGLIKGLPGTEVTLGVERPSSAASPGNRAGSHTPPRGRPKTREVHVTRATISEPVVASETRAVHGLKLGVVELAMFSVGAHSEVRAAVEKELHAGARGIILDLRANGGGLVEEARLIASIFIERGTIVSTRGRTQPSQTITAVGDAISPSLPVVVLVDQDTASASEIVTAALQDHRRATVVGTHTFGKGVFQEEEPLSNGGALDITVGEYFTPNGRNLGGGGVKQGAGIMPEVLVKHGVDSEVGLQAALRTLATKVK